MTDPLKELGTLGQSIWLDYIRRDLMTSGKLKKLIEEDGLKGMTSNPTIFEKAFSGIPDYDEDIRALAMQGKDAGGVYERISVADVQSAADEFRPVYEGTQGTDGYVSLEVSPYLAHDTQGTVIEARRLWAELARPNVFIKVPATAAGLLAIRQLISEGININVTLLFGLDRYRQVAEAYMAGLEARAAQGKSVKNISSVASFFISRIDTLIDPLLEETAKKGDNKAALAGKLKGQTAVASAKMAYQIYKEIIAGERFTRLADQGAKPQRLLWASTSTKNPAYRDVKYVESLVGRDTVNTMPMETLEAYRDHGRPKVSIEENLKEAREVLEQLPLAGIDLDQMTQRLEKEGVEQFTKPFSKLMGSLGNKIIAFKNEPTGLKQGRR